MHHNPISRPLLSRFSTSASELLARVACALLVPQLYCISHCLALHWLADLHVRAGSWHIQGHVTFTQVEVRGDPSLLLPRYLVYVNKGPLKNASHNT